MPAEGRAGAAAPQARKDLAVVEPRAPVVPRGHTRISKIALR
jgi:hypothetical protein